LRELTALEAKRAPLIEQLDLRIVPDRDRQHREISEVIVVPVDKIARCCKRVTERAIAQKIDDLKVHAPPRKEGGTATKV
jgi:hypothetical protein